MIGEKFDKLELSWEDEENILLGGKVLYDSLGHVCGLATLDLTMLRPLLKWHSLFH
jgi:hypothetical protein